MPLNKRMAGAFQENFVIFFKFYNIHTFIQYIIVCMLSWKHLPVVPGIELGPALQQADALPSEPRRTITHVPVHCTNGIYALLFHNIDSYVYYTDLDRQSLIGLHAHSCTATNDH